MKQNRQLWKCPKCKQTFVTKSLWHSCIRLTVEQFFTGKNRQRELFDAWLKFVRQFGEVTVNVTKSRITFQTRIRFGGVARVRKDGIVCRFLLKRQIHSRRFIRTELIPPDYYDYHFLLTDASQLDAEVASWLKESYQVGQQISPSQPKKPDSVSGRANIASVVAEHFDSEDDCKSSE